MCNPPEVRMQKWHCAFYESRLRGGREWSQYTKTEDLVSYNYFAKYTEQTEGNNYFLVFEGTESPEHVIVYHQCKLQFQK